MKVELNSNVLSLVTSVETDVTRAVHEALNLWLKERLTVCPISHKFCVNPNIPCNDCSLTKR